MQASVNERELVLDMLLQITRDGEYSHIVIKNVLDKYQYLDKRERAFITRVVNGTLERMIEIDYIINLFSKVKVNKMKPLIRTILRSSVYQMKYMDSVPDSAICNEAVKLAGKRGFVNLKGFVNGVLRNISRNLDKINYPDEKDKVSYLSVKYSLPEWLVKQWLNVYDEETVKTIGSAFLEEKPLTVRFNEHKIKKEDLVGILKKEGVTVGEVPEIPCALSPVRTSKLLRRTLSGAGFKFYAGSIMVRSERRRPGTGCVCRTGWKIHTYRRTSERNRPCGSKRFD